MRFRFLLVLILIAVLMVSSCQQAQPPQPTSPPTQEAQTTLSPTVPPKPPTPIVVTKREPKGIFIEGQSGGDAETLNWILAADASSFSYAGFTLDSLAAYDNNFKVQLRHLAKDIEVSEDGLVYTITIRNDLRWTDGARVTAEDYVYTMKNLMFSEWLNYNYKSSWMETTDSGVMFVEPAVVNETTFTITRKTVEPEFIDSTLYSLTPYPKHIAQKYEGNAKAFTEAPEFNNLTYTGNLGPYKFDEWVRNDKYVVARNPDYYLTKSIGAPYFDKYVVKLFGTPATRQAALEARDISFTGIEPSLVSKFKNMPYVNVYTVPSSGYSILAYNLRDNGWAGLKNAEVRQAISMAVGKETIVKSILEGFAEPAFSFIPRISPWYDEASLAKYGVDKFYDKNAAMELLAKNGYVERRADGSPKIVDKDGKPVKLTFLTTTGSNVAESIAYFIKQELSEIGIEVEIKFLPWATLLSKNIRNKVPNSNQEPGFNNGPKAVSEDKWDMILMGFNSNPIAPSGQEVFFTGEGGLNFYGYYNDKVDGLFRRLRSQEAVNKDNRKKLYGELGNVLSTEQPVNFLIFNLSNMGFQKTVRGIEPGMNLGYNYYLWYFE